MLGTDDEREHVWNYLGRSAVGSKSSSGSRRIKVPTQVREALGISPGDWIHWAFETDFGFLIISSGALERDIYKNQHGPTKLGDRNDEFRSTVPSVYFADHSGGSDLESPVPERARVEEEETRHFVARDAMFDDDPRTCYLLTRRQLELSMTDNDDHWSDRFGTRPRFLR